MKRVKVFPVVLTDKDTIDVKLITEENKVIGFALNLRCSIDGVWYAVYRVDTAYTNKDFGSAQSQQDYRSSAGCL
jgi:hypothetical protein